MVTSVGRRSDRKYFAVCDCDCGTTGHRVQIARFKKTLSCGCKRGAHLRTHDQSSHPAFWRWQGMMRRCYSTDHTSFPNYGGRGIEVCAWWHDPVNFVADMGPAFSPELELDRIDSDGPYSPANCRWIVKSENMDNRRSTQMVSYAGETFPLRKWAGKVGISRKLLAKRIFERGWTVEAAFTTPVLSKAEAAVRANAARHKARGRG